MPIARSKPPVPPNTSLLFGHNATALLPHRASYRRNIRLRIGQRAYSERLLAEVVPDVLRDGSRAFHPQFCISPDRLTMSIDPSSMTKNESMLSRFKTKVAAVFSKPEKATANDISGPLGNAHMLGNDTNAALPTNNPGIKPFAQSDLRKAWAKEMFERSRAQADVEPLQLAEERETRSNGSQVALTNAAKAPADIQAVNQSLPKAPAGTQIATPNNKRVGVRFDQGPPESRASKPGARAVIGESRANAIADREARSDANLSHKQRKQPQITTKQL
jgi:hypothetical protein